MKRKRRNDPNLPNAKRQKISKFTLPALNIVNESPTYSTTPQLPTVSHNKLQTRRMESARGIAKLYTLDKTVYLYLELGGDELCETKKYEYDPEPHEPEGEENLNVPSSLIEYSG